MSLPGETIGSGAAPRCEDCHKMPRIDGYRSAAGFYPGSAVSRHTSVILSGEPQCFRALRVRSGRDRPENVGTRLRSGG